MPRATVNLEPGDKQYLKTCPEGWVQLRRLSYGQKLQRQEHVGKLMIEMKGRKQGTRGEMQMMQAAATLYDYRCCIVDHNLETETGEKLNLGNQVDLNSLDPRIGEEISKLIDDLNNFEDEEEGELGNSSTASGPQ